MISLATGLRVWIAAGHTDMRRGMQSLARQVQEDLGRDPHCGDLYVFRGRTGALVKILWHCCGALTQGIESDPANQRDVLLYSA
jgi:transposase